MPKCYYGKDNRVRCIVPRERIEIRAGEINKGRAEKNEILPELLIREYFFGEKVDYFDNWKDGMLMLRYDDAVYV